MSATILLGSMRSVFQFITRRGCNEHDKGLKYGIQPVKLMPDCMRLGMVEDWYQGHIRGTVHPCPA